MPKSLSRRTFLKSTGMAAAAAGNPLIGASNATASTGRLVVAVGQWGIETPFAWRSAHADKPLWDCVHDSLIHRNPKTFEIRPGLATEWKSENDQKTWVFKLRPGVQFHENWGEFSGEDVKFTVEQNLKPDSQGASAPFFRTNLDRIEVPDKLTVVMHFKTPAWEVPTHFSQLTGYQNISCKKYLESVGEEKAALHPIGTGPFRHVEGKQGDYHRFEAVPNHWRKSAEFRELVIRRIPEAATRLTGLRAGEIDIAQVFGDYLAQARRAGLRIHEVKDAASYWVILNGQTTPDREDYCPQCPWAGDPKDAKSLENARKVRLAMNLAVNKDAIISALWGGTGSKTPYTYWYYPFHKGYSTAWALPPYDPAKAKQLLAEAGYPSGFEVRVNPVVMTYALDGPDVMEAVALDWEKVGIKVRRVPEAFSTFLPKFRARKTNRTHWVYASPPFDEPALAWQRCIWTKGAFNCLCEGFYDEDLEAILREGDTEKRAKLTHDLGQKLYENYHGIMLGTKSTTWAVSNKVASWDTLASFPLENNYEYIKTS